MGDARKQRKLGTRQLHSPLKRSHDSHVNREIQSQVIYMLWEVECYFQTPLNVNKLKYLHKAHRLEKK